jgi:hypothetical protein
MIIELTEAEAALLLIHADKTSPWPSVVTKICEAREVSGTRVFRGSPTDLLPGDVLALPPVSLIPGRPVPGNPVILTVLRAPGEPYPRAQRPTKGVDVFVHQADTGQRRTRAFSVTAHLTITRPRP